MVLTMKVKKEKNIKNKLELIERRTKTNFQKGKKIYVPKSEKKINHSGKNKHKNIEQNKNKKDINSFYFNKSKETNNKSKKCFV